MTDSLRVERSGPDGAIARVTLARPDRHNAFDASLIAELRATFVSLSVNKSSAARSTAGYSRGAP